MKTFLEDDNAATVVKGLCSQSSQAWQESPLIRQWNLLRLLSKDRPPQTIHQLSQELGVCEKTIRRDLKTFQEVGFPVEVTKERFGQKAYAVRFADNASPPLFLVDEALALYLGRRLMEPLAGTFFWDATQRAFQKIRSALGTDALHYAERSIHAFYATTVGTGNYSQKAEMIDDLMVAVEDQSVTTITYQSSQSPAPQTYDIHPYGFAYHRGSLYLVGWSVKAGEIRHWKIDRLEKVERTRSKFDYPKDFDLQRHLSGSFGVYRGEETVEVVVRFSSEVARYVSEARWHESQQLQPQGDGSLIARFTLNDTHEISRWILSFGRHAEVLKPPELRKELAAEIEEMVGRYRKNVPR